MSIRIPTSGHGFVLSERRLLLYWTLRLRQPRGRSDPDREKAGHSLIK